MPQEYDTNTDVSTNEDVIQSTNEINTNVSYEKHMEKNIVGEISTLFDTLHSDRQAQLDTIEIVEDMLRIKSNIETTGKIKFSDEAKNGIRQYLKDAGISRILDTAVSQTYNTTFKNPDKLFNVSLVLEDDEKDLQDEEQNPIQETMNQIQLPEQTTTPELTEEDIKNKEKDEILLWKQYILNSIKKADAKTEFRKGVKNFYKKGEFILRCTWKQDFEIQRRQDKFQYNNNDVNIEMDKYKVTKELTYDGPAIKCLEPENFVWDTSYDNFKDAPKINRQYTPLKTILNNDSYKEFLTEDDINNITSMVKSGKIDNTDLDGEENYTTSNGIKGKMLEVLEFEGDIQIGDEFYNNMKIVIIGRKFVGYFGYNPSLNSSYLYCPYDTDDDTGRGVGLLARLIPTSLAITKLWRDLIRAIGLSINKCHIAPTGAFEGELVVEENGIIEFDPQKVTGNALTPIDYQSGINACIESIKLLSDAQEEFTMRFKYSSGDSPKQSTTLGEVQIVTEAQNTVMGFELDKLFDEIILPLAEKVGQYLANFKEGREKIQYNNHEGENAIGYVDDVVRTKKYNYFIEEPQNSASKKLNNMQFVDALITKIGGYMTSTGQGTLSAKEIIAYLGGGYDIVNPDKFIIPPEAQLPVQGQEGVAPQAPQLPTPGVTAEDLQSVVSSQVQQQVLSALTPLIEKVKELEAQIQPQVISNEPPQPIELSQPQGM